jgi:2-hydroxy-3-keto-5-methylthiopentenyl-1-phosphate phosphatase
MLEINDLKDVAILVDFDGTITTKDTNDILVRKYGNEKVRELNNKYNQGKIDLIDLFNGVFSEIKLTEKEYIDFILNGFELSDGFIEFYRQVKSYNIPFAIVSGGFDNGIIPLLKKHGIEDVTILSNHLIFNGQDITVRFHDKDLNCCEYGPCGNCKVNHYRNFKEKYKDAIYIGDGSTDKKVANIASLVFAKDTLLKYCISNGISHIPWNDFNDINRILFEKN